MRVYNIHKWIGYYIWIWMDSKYSTDTAAVVGCWFLGSCVYTHVRNNVLKIEIKKKEAMDYIRVELERGAAIHIL